MKNTLLRFAICLIMMSYLGVFQLFAQSKVNGIDPVMAEKLRNVKVRTSNEEERKTRVRCCDCPPPLLIIDGIEVESLENIAPEDVESITVLKSEDEIAEYGDKGKDGVIIVKLKKTE